MNSRTTKNWRKLAEMPNAQLSMSHHMREFVNKYTSDFRWWERVLDPHGLHARKVRQRKEIEQIRLGMLNDGDVWHAAGKQLVTGWARLRQQEDQLVRNMKWRDPVITAVGIVGGIVTYTIFSLLINL